MANGLPRVKIITDDDKFNRTRCYIDENEINMVKGVSFHVSEDEVPIFNFMTVGMPDIDMHGQVLFGFMPQTVEDAAKVLQHEFKTNPESYKALVSSIESILRDVPMHAWDSEKVEMIANRIVGI